MPKSRLPALIAVVAALLAGCSQADRTFFPTETGRWWYYETRAEVRSETNRQRLFVANLRQEGDRLIQRRQAGQQHVYSITSDGPRHEGFSEGGAGDTSAVQETQALVLPAHPAAGQRWEFKSRLRVIESRTFAPEDRLARLPLGLTLQATVAAIDETVQVPAGRYTHCVRVDSTGKMNVPVDHAQSFVEVTAEQREWYAPGVGLVRLERKEHAESTFLQNGSYVQELLATGR